MLPPDGPGPGVTGSCRVRRRLAGRGLIGAGGGGLAFPRVSWMSVRSGTEAEHRTRRRAVAAEPGWQLPRPMRPGIAAARRKTPGRAALAPDVQAAAGRRRRVGLLQAGRGGRGRI